MLEGSLKNNSVASLAIWDFSGRLANFAVLFVVNLLLTRLLMPTQFGAFAIVIAIISFSSIFIDLGFRSAIIQSQEITQQQLSTVFFLNLAIGLTLFAGFYLLSGFIERFYGIDGLADYIKITSGIFILNSLSLVPGGLMQKRLYLKSLSIVTTIAAVISGVVAVYLALTGWGVWALVSQQLISAGVTCIFLFIFSGWWPRLQFSLASIDQLLRYGIRLFFAGLFETIFTRLDIFIIGKLFPIENLGFYNRAQSLDNLIKNFASGTTTSIAFPIIARMSQQDEQVRNFYIRCLNIISFLSFLLIGNLFLTCFDIVVILYTEKWIDVGYYFRIMVLVGFVYPVSSVMVSLIAARGNSGGFLKLEILKKAVLFPAYLSFFFGGVMVFLVVLSLLMLVALCINAEFVRREIGISFGEQIWTIFRYAPPGLAAGLGGYFAGFFIQNVFGHLLVVTIVFLTIYLALCYKFKLPGVVDVAGRLRSLRYA